MKNLFVVHTQYNLILALGLGITDFSQDQNHLILFTDFNLKKELENKLNLNFSKVLKIEGCYPRREISAAYKIKKIIEDNKKITEFMSEKYDRVFIVDDMCIQEMYVLKCALRRNLQVDMAWLEDGAIAYFDNGVTSSGMGATPARRFVRKVFFCSMFGLWKYYDLGVCMGGHKLLKKVYLTFPDVARKEYDNKEHCTISEYAFEQGMRILFGDKTILFEENSFLIVMDKIDVYGEQVEDVNALLQAEVAKAEREGVKVYYKYHPRETEQLPALSTAIELDRTIAIESFLINANVKTITVLGIKSTALQTAKKMGYHAISLIKQIDKKETNVVEFYRKIGIECK